MGSAGPGHAGGPGTATAAGQGASAPPTGAAPAVPDADLIGLASLDGVTVRVGGIVGGGEDDGVIFLYTDTSGQLQTKRRPLVEGVQDVKGLMPTTRSTAGTPRRGALGAGGRRAADHRGRARGGAGQPRCGRGRAVARARLAALGGSGRARVARRRRGACRAARGRLLRDPPLGHTCRGAPRARIKAKELAASLQADLPEGATLHVEPERRARLAADQAEPVRGARLAVFAGLETGWTTVPPSSRRTSTFRGPSPPQRATTRTGRPH